MAIKTNRELVAAALEVANKHKTLYVMGCFGAPLTGANVARYCANHEYNKAASRTAIIKAVADQKPPVFGFDCVCLIKGLLWGWTGDASKPYGGASYAVNSVPDVSADGMIAKCLNVSTDFSSIEVGEAVWMSGHIGIYVGDGKAVECTPAWANCVQITAVANVKKITGLNARTWTKHGKLPYITYESAAPSVAAPTQTASNDTPVLRRGDKGDTVKRMQQLLVSAGHVLAVDGSFGVSTETELMLFQRQRSLTADGICGPATWAALSKAPEPAPTQPTAQGQDFVAMVVKYASPIIFDNEGGYGSVNRDDNGAVSLGKVQWHGSRALALMQTIIKYDPAQGKKTLGDALYNEISNAPSAAWNTRTMSAAEATILSALLITAQGVVVQNALAAADITAYVQKGQGYGLTDAGALIYFADGVNQYGTASPLWKSIVENALKIDGSVTAMFGVTGPIVSNKYMDRREKVYKAVLALKLGSLSSGKSPAETTVDAAVSAGVVTDRAYWLGVLIGTIAPNPAYIKTVLDNAVKKISG